MALNNFSDKVPKKINSVIMQQEQRNWYPLSYISMFQKQITELLNHSTQQYALFLRARRNPSAIDNIILDRALDLFGEQQPETLQLYQGQVDRWFEEDANNIYTAPLTQLNADLEIARKLTDDIVELLEELETIEDLLEKDDLEVAIDFLSGILQLPHKQRMNNDAAPSVGRYIPRNTFTITADKIAFYNEAIPLLESFKTLFLQSLGKDPDFSQKVYKRLNLPEDFALDMFLTNRTGIIEDYSIYALKYNGSNAVQRAFNKYRHNFNATALNLFEAATQAHFGFLEICSPIGNQGAVIYDHILDKEYLLIDEEINNIAKNGDLYFLLGYFISFKDFIISTHGSVPININLRGGYCLYEVMQIYQNQCLTNKPTIQEEAQFITDMYKLCLHENLDKDIDD